MLGICLIAQPKLFALIQDYDNHKNIYKPEVIDSKLIGRKENDL